MSTIIEDGGGGGGGGTSRSGEENSPGTPLNDNIGTMPRGSSQQHHPPPSPLSGCYLLVVLPEPHTAQHRELILERLGKGFLSWDKDSCHVDLEKELRAIVAQAPEGEEARNGERLIQYATENLVTEVLIHPQTNTLLQCMRNLLASFTKHRHIIHAGYTFGGNGSWILQDGTFSVADFLDAFGEHEVQRVLRAYENSVTVDISCAAIGEWSTSRLSKEACTRCCRVRLNPEEVITGTSSSVVSAIGNFTNYIGQYLSAQTLDQLMEPSDVVGNIRFSHPTLYVFPGGQGDAALFGINGFNMLVDGGFARKACFWDFARHLDRLDAVLLTRVNNSNVGGMSSVLRKKRETHLYPQIGHFFCNLVERRHSSSPDGDKQADPLTLDLIDIGQEMMLDLRQINLRPHPCYRDPNPINLYHKVGHGTLDMYVLSPGKDSREVRDFLSKWHSSDSKLFAGSHKKDSNNLSFPIQNLASICALLVWQPANPEDTITRILFPGSTPQHKIFEGFERLKHLHFLKHPVCTANTLSPSTSLLALKDRPTIKQKLSLIEKESTTMKKSSETRREKRDTKPSGAPETELTSKPPAAHTTATPAPARVQQQPKTDVKTRKIVENKKIESSDYKPVVKRDISKVADYKDVEGTKKQSDIMKIKSESEKTVKEQPKLKSEAKRKDPKPVKANNKIDVAPKAVKSSVDKKPKQQSIIPTDKKDSSKASPPTPKKIVNGSATTKSIGDYSSIKSTVQSRPTARAVGKSIAALMPAKSAKDANNRKVVEQKNIESAAAAASAAAAVTGSAKPIVKGKSAERKPISRRDRGPSSPSKARVAGSPAKSTRSTPTTSVKSEKDGVIRKIRGGERGATTDSSAVSTPSGIEIDSMTKLAAADKSLTEKSEDMSLDSIESKVLADLKEEREVVEEIEAVLQKAERIEEARKDDHLEGDDEITAEATDKKDDDMTEEDVTADIEEVPTGSKKKSWRKASQELTEEDEYLIVEKEEIYMEDSVQSGEGEQKHVLDAVESEKHKPIDDTEADISEEKEKSDVPEKKQLRDYDEEDEDEEADEEKEEDEEEEEEEDDEEEDEEDDEVASNRAKEQDDLLTAGHKEQLKEEMKDIIASATEIVQKTEDKDDSGKKDSEDITKEPSSLSPDKFDSSEKKTTDTDPMKPEVDQKDQHVAAEKMEESQERISTVESGATTTAPTLPEDERITLDDIKEVIDEKYIADEAEKQKESSERVKADTFVAPSIPAEPKPDIKTFQVRPVIQGIQREIVKTPDEVADLPVHEEVDPKLYRMEDFEKAKEDKPSTAAPPGQQHQQDATPQPPTPSAAAKEQKGVFSFFGKVADKFEKGMDKLTGKSRRDSEKDIDEKSSSKSSSPKDGKARDIGMFPTDEGPQEIIEKSQPEVSQVKVAAITDTAAFLKREIEDVAKTINGGDTQAPQEPEKEDEPPVFETCLLKGHDNILSVTQPAAQQLEDDAEDVEALLEEASRKFKTVKDSLRDSLESLEDKIAEDEIILDAEITEASKTDVVKDTLSEVVEKLVEIKPHTEEEEEEDEDEKKEEVKEEEEKKDEREEELKEKEEKKEEDESEEKVTFVIPKSESFDLDDSSKDFKEAVRDVGEVLAGSAGILIDDKPKDVIEIVKKVAEVLKKDDFLAHDVLFEKDTPLVETKESDEPIKIVDKAEKEVTEGVAKISVEPLTVDKPAAEIKEEPCVKTVIPKEMDVTSPIKDTTTDKMEAMKICSDLMEADHPETDVIEADHPKTDAMKADHPKTDVMEAGIEKVCVKEERVIPSSTTSHEEEEEDEEESREFKGSEIVFDRKLSPDKAQMVMVTPDSPPTSPKMTQLLPTDIKKQLDEGVSLEEIIKNLFITKKRKITIEIVEYITICRKISRKKLMEIIEEIIIEKGVPRNSVVDADLDTLNLDEGHPDDKTSEQPEDDSSSIVADEIEKYLDEKILTKGQKITANLIDEISTSKKLPKRQFIEILEEIIIKRNIPRSSILDVSDKELSNLIMTESAETEESSPTPESLLIEIEKNIVDEYVTKNRRITPYIFEDICIRFKVPRRTLIGIIEDTIKKRNVDRSLIIDITDGELSELLAVADDDEPVDSEQPEVDDKLLDGFVSITSKDVVPSTETVADGFEAVEQEYKIHTTAKDVIEIGKSIIELDVEKVSSHEEDDDDATSEVVEADEKTIGIKKPDDKMTESIIETTEHPEIPAKPESQSEDSLGRVKRSTDFGSEEKEVPSEIEEHPTVRRMLITASSEDGGHETEVCPTGSIKFTKTITPDDSLKSSPIKTTPDQDSLVIDKELPRSGASTPEKDSISGKSTSGTKDAEKITPEDSLEKSPPSAAHRDSYQLQDSLADELDLSKLKGSRTPSVHGDDGVSEKDTISEMKDKSPSPTSVADEKILSVDDKAIHEKRQSISEPDKLQDSLPELDSKRASIASDVSHVTAAASEIITEKQLEDLETKEHVEDSKSPVIEKIDSKVAAAAAGDKQEEVEKHKDGVEVAKEDLATDKISVPPSPTGSSSSQRKHSIASSVAADDEKDVDKLADQPKEASATAGEKEPEKLMPIDRSKSPSVADDKSRSSSIASEKHDGKDQQPHAERSRSSSIAAGDKEDVEKLSSHVGDKDDGALPIDRSKSPSIPEDKSRSASIVSEKHDGKHQQQHAEPSRSSSIAAVDKEDAEKLSSLAIDKEDEASIPADRSKSPSIVDDKSRSASIVGEKHDAKDHQQQEPSPAERSRSSSIAAADKMDGKKLDSLHSDKDDETLPVDSSKSPTMPDDKSRSASIVGEKHEDKDEQPPAFRSRSASIAASDKQDVGTLGLATDKDEKVSPVDSLKSPTIPGDKSRSASIVDEKHEDKDEQQQPPSDRSRSASVAASDKQDVEKLGSLVTDKDEEVSPIDRPKSPSIPEAKSRSASIVSGKHDAKDQQTPAERSRFASVVAGDKHDVEQLSSLVSHKDDETLHVDHPKSPSIPEDQSRSASIFSHKGDETLHLDHPKSPSIPEDKSRSASIFSHKDDETSHVDHPKSPSIPEDKSRSASIFSHKDDETSHVDHPKSPSIPEDKSRSASIFSHKDDEALHVDHPKSPTIPEDKSRSASIFSHKDDETLHVDHPKSPTIPEDKSRSASIFSHKDDETLHVDHPKSPTIPEDKSRSASIFSHKDDETLHVDHPKSPTIPEDKSRSASIFSHKGDEALHVDHPKSPTIPEDKSRSASIFSHKGDEALHVDHPKSPTIPEDKSRSASIFSHKDDEALHVDHPKSPTIPEDKSRSASIFSHKDDEALHVDHPKSPTIPEDKSRSASIFSHKDDEALHVDHPKSPTIPEDKSRSASIFSHKDDETLHVDHPKSPSIPEDKSRSGSIVSTNHDAKDEQQQPLADRSRSSSIAASDKHDAEKLSSLVSDKDDETLAHDRSKSPSIPEDKSRAASIVSEKSDVKDQQPQTVRSRSSSIAAEDKMDVKKLDSLLSEKDDGALPVDHLKSPSIPEDKSRSSSIASEKHDGKDEQQQLPSPPHAERSRSSSVAASDKQDVEKSGSLVTDKDDEALDRSKSPSIPDDKSRSASIVSEKPDDKGHQLPVGRSRSSSVVADDKEEDVSPVDRSKSPTIPEDKSRSASIVSKKADDKEEQPVAVRSRSSSVAVSDKQDVEKLGSLVSDTHDEALPVDDSKSPSIPEVKSRSASIVSEKPDGKGHQSPAERSRSSSVVHDDKIDVKQLASLVSDKDDETIHVDHVKSSIPETKSRSASIVSEQHDDKDEEQQPLPTDRSRSSSIATGDKQDVGKLDSLVSHKDDETSHVDHPKSPSIPEEKSRSASIVSEKHDAKDEQQPLADRSRSSSVAAGDKQDAEKLDSLVSHKDDETSHVDHPKSPSIPEAKSRSASTVSEMHDAKDQQTPTDRSRSTSIAAGDKQEVEKLDSLVSHKDDETLHLDHPKSPCIPEDKSRSASIVSHKDDETLHVDHSKSPSIPEDKSRSASIVSHKDDETLHVDHPKSPSIPDDKSRSASIVSEKHDAKDEHPQPLADRSRSSSIAAGDKQDVKKLDSLVSQKDDEAVHLDHPKSPSIPEDKSRSASIVSHKDDETLHLDHPKSPSIPEDKSRSASIFSHKDDDTLHVDHPKSPTIPEDKSRSASIFSHKDDETLHVDHSKSPSIADDKSRSASIVSEKHDAKDEQPLADRSRSSSIAASDKQDAEKLSSLVSDKDDQTLALDRSKSPSIPEDKSRAASIVSEKHDVKDQQPPTERSRSSSIAAEDKMDVKTLDSLLSEKDAEALSVDHLKSPSIPEDKSRSSSIASEKHDAKDEQPHADRSRSSSIAASDKQDVEKPSSLVSDKDDEGLPTDRSKSPSIPEDKSPSGSIVSEKHDGKDQQPPVDRSRSSSIAVGDKQEVEKSGSLHSDKETEALPVDASKRASIIADQIKDSASSMVDHEKLQIVDDKDDGKKSAERSRSSSVAADDERHVEELLDEKKSSSPVAEKGDADHRKLSVIAQDEADETAASKVDVKKLSPLDDAAKASTTTTATTSPIAGGEVADTKSLKDETTDVAESKSPSGSVSSVVSEKLQVESADGADSKGSRSTSIGEVEKASRSPSIVSEKHDGSEESTVPTTGSSIAVERPTEKPDESRRSSGIIGSDEKESFVASRSASIAGEKILDDINEKGHIVEAPKSPSPDAHSVVDAHDDIKAESKETLAKTVDSKTIIDESDDEVPIDKSRKSSVVSEKESSRISTHDDMKIVDGEKKEESRRESIDEKTLPRGEERKSSTQESKIDISKETLTKTEYRESDEEEEEEEAKKESQSVSSAVFSSVMHGESKLHEKDAVRALEKLAETIAEKSAETAAVKSTHEEITETPKDRSRSHSVFDASEKTPVGRSRTASMYESDSRSEAITSRIAEQPESNEDDRDSSTDYYKHDSDAVDADKLSKIEEYIVDKYIVKREKITDRAVEEIVMIHSIPKYRILELIEAIITKKNVPRDFVVDYPVYDYEKSSREAEEGGQVDDDDEEDDDDEDIPAAVRRDIQSFIDEEFIRKNRKISSKIVDDLVIRKSISRGIIMMIIREIIIERKIRRSDIVEDDINLEDEQDYDEEREEEENVASMSTGSVQRASVSRSSVGGTGEISEEKRVQVETYIMEECVKKGKKITVLVLEQIMMRMSVSRSVLLAIIENIIVTRKMSRTTMVDDAIYDSAETEHPTTSPADPKSSGYSTPETRQYDDKFTKDMSSYSSSDYESPFHKAFVGGMTEIRTTHITTLSGKSTPDSLAAARGETPDSLVLDETRATKTDEQHRVTSIISSVEQQQRVSTTTTDTTTAGSAVTHEPSGRQVSPDNLTKTQQDYKMPGDTKKSVVDDSFEEEPEIITSVKIRREIIEHDDDDDDEDASQHGATSISADVKRTITTVTTVTEPDGKVTTKKDVHESTDRLDGQELLEKLLDSRIIQHTDESASDVDSLKSSRPDSGLSKIVMENFDRPMSPIVKDFRAESRESAVDKRLDDLRSKSATPDSFRSSEVIRTTITTTRTMSEDGDIITTTKEITETTNDKGEVTILTEKTDVKVEDRISMDKDVGERSLLPESGDYDDMTRSQALVGEWERGGYSSEERHVYSDDEAPGSPFSTTSQVGYSPQSTYQQFGDGTSGKDSPSRKSIEFSEADMSSSFYGQLPDLPPRVTTLKPSYLDDDSHDLGSGAADFSFKKFTVDDSSRKSTSSGDVDKATDSKEVKRDGDVATKPSSSEDKKEDTKKDPLKDWGSPLGLPSPKPPRKFNLRTSARTSLASDNNISPDSLNFEAIDDWGEPMRLPSPGPPADDAASNKTTPAATPKNERKQPKKVVAENIKNKKVSDSPSKKDKKINSKDGTKRGTAVQAIYMDLTYVPHHGNSYYTSLEFFKRVRARYYVFSGTEPSREVYDALLDAKKTWEDKHLEVTMIPTYDTDTLGYWVADNEEALAANHIDLSPSASRCTINLQDHETSCSAYRLEF